MSTEDLTKKVEELTEKVEHLSNDKFPDVLDLVSAALFLKLSKSQMYKIIRSEDPSDIPVHRIEGAGIRFLQERNLLNGYSTKKLSSLNIKLHNYANHSYRRSSRENFAP